MGAAEVDYYFGGLGASDRLAIAQIDGAVIESVEETDRGLHVNDDNEKTARGVGGGGAKLRCLVEMVL